MVNSMVARATNNMLIGPDWAMNLEICDICNRDPVQAKDVIKGIKKRLGSKNPKVQLLALTLLETIMKNCGDIVHLQVAERNLLHDMVKIVKKKPDFHVKEKILILIDTWQEAFGGARGRYPQYYAAYHDLLRLGVNFPERSESLAPVLTPPQTQPITSIPHNLRNPENEIEAGALSAEADFPTLSLTELQNARGVMDVLAEMLTAIDPEKKEALKQEVIVDLVEQCRTYKRRLVHLVNSTSDESLLCQGLALNDDLQRVLAKHEALLKAPPVVSSQKSNPETSQALVPVKTPLNNATGTKQPGSTSGASAEPDLISLEPVTTNGESTSTKVNFDLLSGDDFDSNPLAIVPVGETQPATPVSQQNALALVPMFSPQAQQQPQNMWTQQPQTQQQPQNMWTQQPQTQQQPQNIWTQQPQNMSAQQTSFYPNRNAAQNESWATYNQGNNPMWNGHMAQQQQQQQQPALQGFGAAMNNSLPPPPWEAPPSGNQLVGGGGGPQYSQPHGVNMNSHMLPMNNQSMYTNQIPQQQMAYMYPQQMGQQMYGNQMGQVYGNGVNQMGQVYGNGGNQMGQVYGNGGNQMGQVYGNGGYGYGNGNGYGYGYGQQQNAQLISKNMPVKDESFLTSTVYTGPSMANASYVHVSSRKPQNAEDKLFGDLVDFSKVKTKKT